MSSTVICTATLVGLLLASVVLWGSFHRLGLRWAKVRNVTTRRVVLATVIVIILQVALRVPFLFISPSSDAESILFGLVELAANVIVAGAVISTVFKARFLRALQAWLPTLLTNVLTAAFALLVLRPFVYETFVVLSNAMAPTIIGQHWTESVRKCGKPNYCSPRDERDGIPDPLLMICDNFHVTEAADIDTTVHSGDRLMVAKFLTPRRWDLVVFQYPEEPATPYVKRLVGFPGEKIHIQDGAVWVDGKKQMPPESLNGIEYSSDLRPSLGPDLWGSPDRPAVLGNDEYFVLGDFSVQSNDSRLWRQGAPGHNSFAVPESHMKGVVIHTAPAPCVWRCSAARMATPSQWRGNSANGTGEEHNRFVVKRGTFGRRQRSTTRSWLL